jgi:tetratricopeptide (TPR) repeat protein
VSIVGLVAAATAAASAQNPVIVTRPDHAVARAEEWVLAVLAHHPGEHDAVAVKVAAWSQPMVDDLLVELAAIRDLAKDSEKKGAFVYPIDLDRGRPREIRYSGSERRSLTRAASALRQAGLTESDFVMRAMILHTDVAIGGAAGELFRFTDGQQMNREPSTADHWAMARMLSETINRKAGRDQDVAFWYRATLTYMAGVQLWNGRHALRALERFEDDGDLAFIVGCLHERLAAPRTQASMAASRLPAGVRVRVGSENDELREATSLYKRAFERNANHAEARLRYGRVLLLAGRVTAAIPELRRALAGLTEPEQRYYAHLFLGEALEATTQLDDARAAYQAAVTLMPKAQAPRLALSHLAASRGHRAEATQAIASLFEIAEDERSDPWWEYFPSCGRNANALLATAFGRMAAPGR